MTDDFLDSLVDYVFNLAEKSSAWLKTKAEGIKSRFKKYYRKSAYRLRLFERGLREKWQERWKPILKYGVYSFTPYVLVYGALLNLITLYFLSYPITPMSVIAHGTVWYFIKEELFGEMIPELRPTVKADVKVKDR